MNPLELSEPNPERLITILEQHHREIYENWISALRQKWADQAEKKLSFLDQKIADRKDLFSFLRACSGKTDCYYQCFAPLINLDLIISKEYSILDVFDEAVLLKDSILHLFKTLEMSGGELEQLTSLVHDQIFALVQGLLCGAKELLSCLVEGGTRGYCQVDEQGRIICANQEFQLSLNRKPNPGEPLDQLFVENDRGFFTQVFTGQTKTPPGPQRLHLDSPLQGPILVGTELCPMVIGGQLQGWYVCLVDISATQKKEHELYENLPVGLVQVDKELKFRYANPKFLEILGLNNNEWQDKTLWDFLPDETNRRIIEDQIKERRQGKRGAYTVTFTRKNGYQVPIKIYAVREEDLNGSDIGSFAVVRSMERENAETAMAQHMATSEKWKDMLVKVIREAKPFIPSDLCVVSEISSDQKHLRRLLTEPPVENAMSKIGRWGVPDRIIQWLKDQKEIYFDELEGFLSRPDFAEARKDSEIQWILDQGYRFFIRLPIIQDVPIASLTFLSKTLPYNETHAAMLRALPLGQAVRLALSWQKEEEFKFFFELIKKISKEGKDFLKVAKILVDELGDHYHWGNVALFRIDEDLKRFVLLNQKDSPGGTPPIEEGYEQPLDQGILGYVFRTGESVNCGNVREDPRFKDVYVSPWKTKEEVVSELCLPLKTQDTCFLLNIEDPKLNAFSDEEVKALEFFGKEAEAILERSWLYHSLTAALQSTSDAIIHTNRKGRITRSNRAAAQLLGYTEEDMEERIRQGLSLEGHFQDGKVAEKALTDRYFPSQEVTWVDKAKKPVDVLLSASSLPDELGGKIFTAKNLAERDRVEQLEHLESSTRISPSK